MRLCPGRDYLKSCPTCFAQHEFSSSGLSRAEVKGQDDPSWMSLEYHQLTVLVSSVGAVCGKSRIFRVLLSLNSVISFTNKGLKWFEQDQGLPVQAHAIRPTHGRENA